MTFPHPLCYVSRRRGCLDRYWTLCCSWQASNSSEWIATRNPLANRGGGICFYINSSWCNDVTVIQKHCFPIVEYFIINCKPFYAPREFVSFILVGVYIPPQANVQDAQHIFLSHELPKYKQFIKCSTREKNVLDHCYSTVSRAYHAVPRAALCLSDHAMVHLIPSYRQKIKLCKPVARTLKQWTSEAAEDLQVCLESMDWNVSALLLKVWRSTQRLWHHTWAFVSTAVYYHAPGWVLTTTNHGS